MSSECIAETFARWSTSLRPAQLPPDVVALAKLCVLDCCALAVGGVESEPGRAALSAIGTYGLVGSDGCLVLGTELRLSAGDAALLNGLLAHALQSDDGIRRAHGHPGTSVIPAALACSEIADASGSEFLTAVVAGYEVFARLGEAINPSHLSRGFHPSGTVGAVAAAAAAAKALDLDERATTDALGLAGSTAAGLMEYAPTGTMATYLVTGNAARVGVQSALLAGQGFTGPRSVVEGSKGMAAAMADEVDLEIATSGLTGSFRLRETYFKPYPACRHSHAAIDAALQLSAPTGLDPEAISDVEVRAYLLAVDECDHPDFDSLAGADTSFQYTVASALRFGDFKLGRRSMAAVRDPITRGLSAKVRVVHDPAFDARLPHERPARVTVTCHDGTRRSAEVALPRGEPETALSPDELQQKALDAAVPVLGRGGALALVGAVDDLDKARSISALLNAARPAKSMAGLRGSR
jgi:2-methylcitrate dehydratase PrpD